MWLSSLVYLEGDIDGSNSRNIVMTIIVGVSIFVSCVMIMVLAILAVTVLYKKRLKSSERYTYITIRSQLHHQ